MKKLILTIIATSVLMILCTSTKPMIEISNQLGKLEYWKDTTTSDYAIIHGLGMMHRDGKTRQDVENGAGTNALKLTEQLVFKLCPECNDKEKITQCTQEKINAEEFKFAYMSDGTIKAIDTLDRKFLDNIIECVKQE